MTLPDSSTSFLHAAASHNTVFIDTNLDTHLAMAASDGDTVSDFKVKIEKEHPLCFPHLGNVKVLAIKVMQRGFFYHLSDSMFLKSAFAEFDSSWFLSIDVSVVHGHSTDPNTGNLLTYFERADDTTVGGINLARNNHCRQSPNYDAPQLQDNVTKKYVNEKALYVGSCHSSKKDLMIEKAEVTHCVENCNKGQSGRTRNGCEGFIETLKSLPTVKLNHKSKKIKKKSVNEHEVVKFTRYDNDQNPSDQVIGSCEKFREHLHNEVSNLPVLENKSNVDKPGQISSSNTHDEFEHGTKRKYNLSEETEDGKNDTYKNPVRLMDSSFEVAARAGSTAKKQRKSEMISGVMNDIEGNGELVSDSRKATSTPKVTSEYLSDNKQTAKVVIGSLSTEPDACLLETGSNDVKRRKKKRKSKLSGCPNQTVGLISSGVGNKQDASRESDITTVPISGIKEASIHDLGTSGRERHNDSIDKTAENFAYSRVGDSCGNKNMELGGVQSISDASDKPVLEVKRTIDSKDLASKSEDPAALQKTISTPEDATNVQSNHLTRKTGKIVAIPEERVYLQNADTKALMVENCYSSSWDGTDANIKATHICKSLHLKGTTENPKHGKKEKNKKSRDSAEERRINSVPTGARDSAGDIPPTEPQSYTLGDSSCSKAEIGESKVSLMKGENTTGASLPNDRNIDVDKPNMSQVEPLPLIDKTRAAAEDMDGGQGRKKIKKGPLASMKSTPDLQAESNGNEDSLPSKRSDRKVKSVSIVTKKTKFPKVKSRNEFDENNLDSTVFTKVESSPSICKTSKAVGSSLTPSHVSEGYEERYLEANRCSNTTKDGTADNVDNPVEVPSESNKVGIEEKADGTQHESVKLHVDKLGSEKSTNTLVKAKRKMKNPSACSSAASLSMQNIQKSDENTESGGQCQTSNSNVLKLHGPSSKDKCVGMLHVDNELKKISKGGVESLPFTEHRQKISDSSKATRLREKVVNSSRDSTEIHSETSALPSTRLKLKKSASMVHQDQKHIKRQSTSIGHPMAEWKPSQDGKKDVTQSERRNLLAASGGIFKDASSDSFEYAGGIADSDASTRSPDNSLTSDFSEGESNGNINSSENGSIDSERTNIHRRSTRKKFPSSPEDMTLDTILRSSSRYKKAKITATQLQQEDTESQPVDFVPDSQAKI